MALSDKLTLWREAGLIDSAAAERIAAFEAARARPVWLWAVAGLGCLALALGIAALIASNWDAIPAALKLGAHFLLTLGAAAVVLYAARRERLWTLEVALFLLAALLLAGFALQSQIYQRTGEIWQLLLPWFLLAAPAMLVAGRTRLTAYSLAGMSLWTFVSLAAEMDGRHAGGQLLQGLAVAVPWLLVTVGALLHRRAAFAGGLIEAGLVVLLPAASLAHLIWAGEITAADALDNLVRLFPACAAATAALLLARRRGSLPDMLTGPLLAGPLLALALAVLVPHDDDWPARLAGALIYGAMWGWIGWAAARCGWRFLFGIAVGAVAVRLFIIYFELFGSLAMTGIGLIAAGLLLLGLAFASRRILREMPE
jgi:hypothetical protein